MGDVGIVAGILDDARAAAGRRSSSDVARPKGAVRPRGSTDRRPDRESEPVQSRIGSAGGGRGAGAGGPAAAQRLWLLRLPFIDLSKTLADD